MHEKHLARKEFMEKVFPAEIEEIKARREHIGAETEDLDGRISVKRGLVGLAISGGGIRSATFSLGVIQGLAQQGWLKAIDYLSTVSGGGYIGSCVSSLLNDPKSKSTPEEFPLRYTEGDVEPDSLTHLRNSSNYLSPGGLLDKLRLPNVLLRGVLLNLFIFMPYIMAAVFFTEVAYEKGPNWDDLATLLFPLSMLFVAMSIIFPFATRFLRRRFNWKWRNRFELWLTVPLLLVFVILLTIPLLHLTRVAIEHNSAQVISWFDTIGPMMLWKSGAVFIIVVGLFMFAGKASVNIAQWRGKLLITLLGFLGPSVIFAIYFILCLWQIDSPFIPVSSVQPLNAATQCEEPCLAVLGEGPDTAEAQEVTTLGDLFREIAEPTEEVNSFTELVSALHGRSVTVTPETIVTCESNNCDRDVSASGWRSDDRVWVLNDAPAIQPNCPEYASIDLFENIGVVGNCHYIVRDSADQLRIEGDQLRLFSRSEDFVFMIVFISLLLFNRFFLDMNITSMHGFYRDRLSKAFLIRRDEDGNVFHMDKQKLSEMSAPGTMAPYHILNVALNLQASNDIDLRGRKADFFMFSKRFIGSDRTGFSRTEDIEHYDSHLDLGTAMAVSGAAAAPNMGTSSNRSLSFILTLLNIRLGYWLPNPREVNRPGWFKWLTLGGAKPTLIWREALGKLDASSSHVNLSDGGHIENLGLYPLLKRRCKQIILIDGEADPEMTFGGLVTAMRYARIDMGIKIEIDLNPIRKNEEGLSEASWALGSIHYGDGEIGHLIYIKLSVVGTEPEYVRAYRTKNPNFPHESTSDQFFSEDPFEAYRALSEHICKNVMRNKEETLAGFGHLDKYQRQNR